MTTYRHVVWHHDDPSQRDEIYAELEDQLWEARKIHRFRDGRLERASQHGETENTVLGRAPWPSDLEIQKDPQFKLQPITDRQFADLWDMSARVDALAEDDRSITLGAEYDKELFRCIVDVLKEMGAKLGTHEWGVGGSQEVSIFNFTLRGVPLVLEMETYMGTTLLGEPSLIAEIAEKVRKRFGPRQENTK